MSAIEDSVCRKIQERAALGLVKYGQGLDRKDFTLSEWLTHLQQEMMDGCGYAEKAIAEAQELHALCGEIIETIIVNRGQGRITCIDEIAFTDIIESWKRRFHGTKPKNLLPPH
jgi:hypothetical protein